MKLLVCLVLLFPAALAAEAPAINQAVEFRGDTLEARRQEGLLKLTGNVRIDHGDSTITSDKMTIYYLDDQKTIDRIVAEGNVQLQEPQRRGRAGHAVYLPATQQLTLTESPQIWDGGNQLTGSQITIFRNPDRLSVEKARAVVQPDTVDAAVSRQKSATETTDP